MKVFTGLLIMLYLATSISAYAETSDAIMIDHHQKTVIEEMDAKEKATRLEELRPSATVKNKSKAPAERSKESMIKHQKKQTAKSIADDKASIPELEARPAATTSQK
jgi:hypothetical protein